MDTAALLITVVGALNWGLVALFDFDLVAWIGGGHWTLGMLRDYPERILAAVCYSAAFDPSWSYPAATAEVPVLLRHAGPQDAPSALCQATAEHSFSRFRSPVPSS